MLIFPSAETLGEGTFRDCVNLSTINVPTDATRGLYSFANAPCIPSRYANGACTVECGAVDCDDFLQAARGQPPPSPPSGGGDSSGAIGGAIAAMILGICAAALFLRRRSRSKAASRQTVLYAIEAPPTVRVPKRPQPQHREADGGSAGGHDDEPDAAAGRGRG